MARQDHRGPFRRAEQCGARHGQGYRPAWTGQRARLGAVAVPAPYFAALIRPRSQRGAQLLVDGRLDGEPNVLVDQLAQRDPLGLMRSSWLPDTLAHGAFLRWPPCQAAGWSCTSSTRKNAPFLFFHMTRDATTAPCYGISLSLRLAGYGSHSARADLKG